MILFTDSRVTIKPLIHVRHIFFFNYKSYWYK